MICPDLRGFIQDLEQSRVLLAEFERYLIILKNQRRWTPVAMAVDPVILRVYAGKGGGDSFRRALDRVIRGHRCPTERTLARFARVFFGDDGRPNDRFVQEFARWHAKTRAERIVRTTDIPALEVRRGRWVLSDG